MPNKYAVPRKEVYQLWWEYWKRTKTFTEIKKWAKKNKFSVKDYDKRRCHFPFKIRSKKDNFSYEANPLFLRATLDKASQEPFETWWSIFGKVLSDISKLEME